MLMLGGDPKTQALGNFYFSPVRLRPVYQPAFSASEEEQTKLRSKANSKLDLTLNVRPESRHDDKHSDELDLFNSNNLTEVDEGDESVSETESPEDKKRPHRKKKKKKKGKSSLDNSFENLCPKLRLSFVLSILGVIVLAACCCALFLRNWIVACCKRCARPFKRKNKSQKKNLFDVEEGDYPHASSRLSSFGKSNKKKKGPARLIDTGVQDSRTSIKEEENSGGVGCSPCSKKKKKKKSKKRRK